MESSLVPLALVVGTLAALAFVLVPLVRNEEDLQSLRRSRPGMRHLHGRNETENGAETVDGEIEQSTDDERRCPHCGATVDPEFRYCGECCSPLPE